MENAATILNDTYSIDLSDIRPYEKHAQIISSMGVFNWYSCLLIASLFKHKRITLQRDWPFEEKLLEDIFHALGYSYNN